MAISMSRVDTTAIEALVKDASILVRQMADPTRASHMPMTMMKDSQEPHKGLETTRRMFQRFVIELLAETKLPVCQSLKPLIEEGILNAVADCDEWLGVETCHKALVNAFGETRPIGWLVSHWNETRPDFAVDARVAARIAGDPSQDKYWMRPPAPIMRVKPRRSMHDPARALVPTAIAQRPDGLELLDKGWLHRCPMTHDKGFPRRDVMGCYGHARVLSLIAELKQREEQDVAIRQELWARQFHDFV